MTTTRPEGTMTMIRRAHTYTCARCGAEFVEPATGHTDDNPCEA